MYEPETIKQTELQLFNSCLVPIMTENGENTPQEQLQTGVWLQLNC